MMQTARRHKRFKLDLMEMGGEMILAHKVEITDISLGGVALKTDRRLNVGKEFSIELGIKGKSIDVTGTIVRCGLTNIEKRSSVEGASIHTAGMMFNKTSTNMIANFIDSIELEKKEALPVMADRRLNVRFYLTTPWEKILSFPVQYKVKVISQSGMLIQAEEALSIESMIPMGLSLQENKKTVNFIGRVASCQRKGDKGQEHNEIGVEFKDLMDEDRTLLKTFINYLTVVEVRST